jgi:hypothetical protein
MLIVRRFVLFPIFDCSVLELPIFENGPPMIAPASLPKYPVKIPNNNVNFRSNIRSLLSCHGGYGNSVV